MQVEFDGSRVDCFELVEAKDASEVEDHKIEVIGPDFDEFEEMCIRDRSTMLRSWLRWRRSSARQERKMWRYRLRKPSRISIRAICI